METEDTLQEELNELMTSPSLLPARQFEQRLIELGYRKMVFGRINQKSSIDAASGSDRGVVERITNAFDASVTASRGESDFSREG